MKTHSGITIVEYSNMNFQRNGVAGESFYSLTIDTKEQKNERGKYLITFKTDETDTKILRGSCRVVDLNNLTECYRGDQFADALNDMFSGLVSGFALGSYAIYDFLLAYRKLDDAA
ncbi:MAG: hypothetical protein IPJ03_16220 [Ignavibacteriales bacterium]|nr:hypothetical protein [Ignavibacteriales bacterium]